MIKKDEPILCSCCGKDTGFTMKGLQMYLIPPGGLKCKHCGYVFMRRQETYLASRERQLAWSAR